MLQGVGSIARIRTVEVGAGVSHPLRKTPSEDGNFSTASRDEDAKEKEEPTVTTALDDSRDDEE